VAGRGVTNKARLSSVCYILDLRRFVSGKASRDASVSRVWARIVESEKPVFTVIFRGAAAFATAISEAAKHL
jgi:hypothetical protein